MRQSLITSRLRGDRAPGVARTALLPDTPHTAPRVQAPLYQYSDDSPPPTPYFSDGPSVSIAFNGPSGILGKDARSAALSPLDRVLLLDPRRNRARGHIVCPRRNRRTRSPARCSVAIPSE